MKIIPFVYQSKYLNMGIIDNDTPKQLQDKLNKRVSILYKECFDSETMLNNLIYFSTNNGGVNIIIFDDKYRIYFLCTFIVNHKNNTLELYNVCKDLTCKKIGGCEILDLIIDQFLNKSKHFQNYSTLTLALLLKSKFIVQSMICYQNLGFKIDKNIEVSQVLPPHICMTIDFKNRIKVPKEIKINDFI